MKEEEYREKKLELLKRQNAILKSICNRLPGY